jgi:hypothetical protein
MTKLKSYFYVVASRVGLVDLDKGLRWASLTGETATAKTLLAAGADVHARSDDALKAARLNGYTDIVTTGGLDSAGAAQVRTRGPATMLTFMPGKPIIEPDVAATIPGFCRPGGGSCRHRPRRRGWLALTVDLVVLLLNPAASERSATAGGIGGKK